MTRRGAICCALFFALTVIILAGPTLGVGVPLARYNTSPSVPLGWWVYSRKWPPQVGDVVMMRDPPGFRHNWLLKRVHGVGGDLFCWHEAEKRHTINGRPMTPVHFLAYEHNMPIWRGCRPLEPDEVAGFGDVETAYGSQYFGPVKLSQLWGVYAQP